MNEQINERMNESSRVASLGMELELDKNDSITRAMAIYGGISGVITARSGELASHVKENIQSNANTVGGGIWYEPYSIYPNKKHHSAYAFRDENNEMVVTMDYAEDIDYLLEPWYVDAINANGEMIWTDVYFDPVPNVMMITSSQAFFDSTGRILGVATADMALTDIQQIVGHISIGETGRAFIVGRSGEYISYIDDSRTLDQTIQNDTDPDLAALGKFLSSNITGSQSMSIDNKPVRVYFSTLPNVEWKLVILIDRSEIESSTINMVLLMAIVPVVGLIVVCISIILVSRHLRRIVTKVNSFADKAALGDLSERIEVSEVDEFGEMEDHLNQMIENMSEMNRLSEKALQDAQAANKAKSEFLSRMSHEIRTPMNAIIGMTQIASETDDLTKIQDCLDKTSTASKHLLSLINDILDMSKIEANKLDLFEECFDLRKSIEGAKSIIGVKVGEKSQHFSVNVDANLPNYVKSDEMRFLQVLVNLLSNAVKFTPENGEISLSVVRGDTLEDGRFFVISKVTDTGIGISKENLDKLFVSFEQADGGIARRFGGTGLGLAISKRIVELMGGEITVESELDKGTTFTFSIAVGLVDESAIQVNSEPENTSAPDLSGKTLLVAEDIEINREVAAAILEETHALIVFAENGEQAVEIFTEAPGKFVLILMDIQMPKMDGYEATRRIRRISGGENIPIIALSANSFREDVEEALKSGMHDHIGKPISPPELFMKLRKYVK